MRLGTRVLGRETEAVSYYEQAIQQGLTGAGLAGAYLGLGSTLRALGDYDRALKVLENAVTEFPENRSIQVFRAMALYHVNRSKEAISSLLKILMEQTTDTELQGYRRALLMYADDLDRVW